ncbi:MAG: helix-turn-helix transcriptional regulator [Oxalicibacterium faecigallinarum]|uniref:helix-turn-helix domain-containing protein n=1 Tax=Oxalicibacterium faecigallinarum TaxID=573741 RepID=UPI0028093D5A|nr:helix-turn-helix transcriptional regulator [Oxalicibacterium faecigallinarum]MDQ7969391.1 helix-turn-helix transcriptional regulator [Oxalicibacterium faecigallinarum]
MSTDLAVRIGKNISSIRKARGVMQAALAEAVGIDTVTLSRIETGKNNTSLMTLDAIANELQAPLSFLLNGASGKTAALAEDIASTIEPLSEADRLFVLEQVRTWAAKLSSNRKKK